MKVADALSYFLLSFEPGTENFLLNSTSHQIFYQTLIQQESVITSHSPSLIDKLIDNNFKQSFISLHKHSKICSLLSQLQMF